MTRHGDDERQPLLPIPPATEPPRWHSWLQEYWPILRVLILNILWGSAAYGSAPSILDSARSYTCAYHYSQHPHLLPSDPHASLPSSGSRPCAVAGVERKVGVVLAILNGVSNGVTSLAMIYYGPKLSIWGRKPLLLLGVASCALGLVPYLLLPLGYPYGPVPSEISVSPRTSLVVILLVRLLQALTGFEALAFCVVKVCAVDVSKPENRSLYLTWALSAGLLGCFIGPAMAAWALESNARKHAGRGLFGIGGEVPTQPPVEGGPPSMPPVVQPDVSIHGNTGALKLCLVIYLLALLWGLFVIPESLPESSPEQVPEVAKPGLLGPLSIYFPHRDARGRKDYRLTKLAVVAAMITVGANAINQAAVFVGYRFDWGAERLGFLLGLIGATRAAWLVLAIPLVRAALVRLLPPPPEPEAEEGVLRRWRTRIELVVCQLSFLVDGAGSFLLVLASSTDHAPLFVAGVIALSFGVAAPPALASAAISLANELSLHNPADTWLAAISVSNGFINFAAPLLYNLVYSLTVEGELKFAYFLIPAVAYLVALVAVTSAI